MPAEQTVSASGNDELFDVATDADGSIYLCGFITQDGTGQDGWVAKGAQDPDGNWEQFIVSMGGGVDRCWGLELAPNGTVIAAGYTETSDGDYDVWVRRIAR